MLPLPWCTWHLTSVLCTDAGHVQAYMLGRLRQSKAFPVGTTASTHGTNILPEMIAGPMPVLAPPDTVDMQTVKVLIAESEKLGLLCEPYSNKRVGRADKSDGTDPVQTASRVEAPPENVRLTATEHKQVLTRKAGKQTKSRYQELLHIAMNRQKERA